MRMAQSTCVRVTAVALMLSCGGDVGASAQDRASAPMTTGKWSLALALPSGGGGSMGLWRMVGDRTNLGVELTPGWNHYRRSYTEGSLAQEVWNVRLSPIVQRYLSVNRRVAPFMRGGIELGLGYTGTAGVAGGGHSANRYHLGASIALGVECFALADISVNGYTGSHIGFDWDAESGSSSNRGHTLDLGTFMSSIILRIYF